VSGDADEIMGEIVVGLGEALVGNYPGRALGFTVNKKTGQVKTLQLPSKHIGVYLDGDTLIFRYACVFCVCMCMYVWMETL
jgi:alpha-glucan,water dikinase